MEVKSLGAMLSGVLVFGLGALALSFWRFEGRDY
jgi:hypothetical protein